MSEREESVKGSRGEEGQGERERVTDSQGVSGGGEPERERLKENCVILQSGCEMFAFLCLFISQPALRSDAMLKTKEKNNKKEIKCK